MWSMTFKIFFHFLGSTFYRISHNFKVPIFYIYIRWGKSEFFLQKCRLEKWSMIFFRPSFSQLCISSFIIQNMNWIISVWIFAPKVNASLSFEVRGGWIERKKSLISWSINWHWQEIRLKLRPSPHQRQGFYTLFSI